MIQVDERFIMDDYDYENYGMEYDAYNPSETDSSVSNESTTESDVEEEITTLDTIDTFDSQRISELDLGRYDFPHQSKYPARSYIASDNLPAVAVLTDHRRVSIHPLGVVEKPAGVSESFWAGLDADGLYPETRDITVKADRGTVTAEGKKGVPAKRGKVTASGGSGGDITTDETEEEHDPSEMPFLDHLEEFRWSLLKSIFIIVIGMISSWFLTDIFYTTITRLAKSAELPLITTKLMETLMIKLQMALVMGLVIALPFVFYFMWSFVSPGLYYKEKKWILPLVFGTTICFFIGASIAYFIIIPVMLSFLKNFIPAEVEALITIGDFIGKLLKFTIFFGLIFELPMIAYVLAKIGILKYQWMSLYRKYAIVCIFVIGALLTPPEPISQIMMAVPLLLLYEVSILVARFAGRNTVL